MLFALSPILWLVASSTVGLLTQGCKSGRCCNQPCWNSYQAAMLTCSVPLCERGLTTRARRHVAGLYLAHYHRSCSFEEIGRVSFILQLDESSPVFILELSCS